MIHNRNYILPGSSGKTLHEQMHTDAQATFNGTKVK